MTELFVTASNDFPDRVLVRERFIVGEREPRAVEVRHNEAPEGYYVLHPRLGVGRVMPTPEDAIRDLLEAAGCTNVQIRLD